MNRAISILLITFLLSEFTKGQEIHTTKPEKNSFINVLNNKRKRADRYFNNLEYEPAIRLYNKIAGKGKVDDMVKLRLAESYLKMEDLDSAEKWFAEAINSEQVTPNHQIQYAQVLLSNGKFHEAREVIDTYEFADSDYRSQDIINTLDKLEGSTSDSSPNGEVSVDEDQINLLTATEISTYYDAEDYEQSNELSTINASIVDEDYNALANTDLTMITNGLKSDKLISNAYGKVSIQVSPEREYTIIATKEGYVDHSITIPAETLGQQEDLLIVMKNPSNQIIDYQPSSENTEIAGVASSEFPEWSNELSWETDAVEGPLSVDISKEKFNRNLNNQMHLVETSVIDAISGEKLNMAVLKLFVDSPNQELEYEISDGILIFEARPDEDYIIVASHADYQDQYITLSGAKLLADGSEHISLELAKIQHLEKEYHGRSSTKFKTLVRDEETREQLEDAVVKFFVDGKAIESEFSKENGKTIFKSPKGKDYMMLASRQGYQDLIYHLPGAPEENMEVDLAMLKEVESGPNSPYRQLAIKGYAFDEFSGKGLDGVTYKIFENGDLIETTQRLSTLKIEPDKRYQVLALTDGYSESIHTINPSQLQANEPVSLQFALSEEKISEATGNPVYQEIEGNAVPVNVRIIDITDDQVVSEALITVFADNQVQEKVSSWQSGMVTVNALPGKEYQLLVKRAGYNDKVVNLEQLGMENEIQVSLIPNDIQKLSWTGLELNDANILVMSGPNGQEQLFLSTNDALYRYEVENEYHYLINGDQKILLEENSFKIDGQATSIDNFNLTLSENKIAVKETFNINSIYYDFDKANIREDAAAELDKLAAILSSNINIKVVMLSHTDSRGGSKYNNALSKRRGMAAVQYLVDKGIDIGRLTNEAKGETQLVNSCNDTVKCAEEAHQLNRRTEFIFRV